MALKKCPRCELNYIQETDKMCNVCRRDICGDSDRDEFYELCAQCGEHPTLSGDDLCVLCKKELKVEEGEAVKAMMGETMLEKDAMNGIASVSPMDVDEIVIDEDNPPPDFEMDDSFNDEDIEEKPDEGDSDGSSDTETTTGQFETVKVSGRRDVSL